MAEEEVCALDHAPGLRSCPRTIWSKNSPGLQPQQGHIGRIGDHGVDPQLAEQFGLPLGPAQRRRGLLGAQQRAGCGSKVRTTAGPPSRRAMASQPLDDPRVARDGRRRNCRSTRRRREIARAGRPGGGKGSRHACVYSPGSRITGSMTFVLRSTARTMVRCSAPSPLLATTGST